MLNHKDVWNGIDQMAAGTGFSPSGLARRAGLDPTTFNKSKRINPQGKPRWPTTESISKILEATGLTLSDFVQFVGAAAGAGHGRRYPLIGGSPSAPVGMKLRVPTSVTRPPTPWKSQATACSRSFDRGIA
jgi:hypothetical protein